MTAVMLHNIMCTTLGVSLSPVFSSRTTIQPSAGSLGFDDISSQVGFRLLTKKISYECSFIFSIDIPNIPSKIIFTQL